MILSCVYEPMIAGEKEDEDEKDEEEEDVNYLVELGKALIPVDVDEWPDMRWYNRIFEIFKVSSVGHDSHTTI